MNNMNALKYETNVREIQEWLHIFIINILKQQYFVGSQQRYRNMYERNFALHFLRGSNPNLLTQDQQQQIYKLIFQDKFGESHLFYNSLQFERKWNQWQENLSFIQPYYAMKSNPAQDLINDISKKGAGIDVGSKSQIILCQKLGISMDKIIYSNTVKCQNDILYADKAGIKLTVADTIQQLIKIKKFAPNIRILWRIAMKGKAQDSKMANFFAKFGDDLQNEQMIENRMKQIADLGINLKGIHFNTGPSKYGCGGFDKGIEISRKCMEIGRKYGHDMDILNVGGGFPHGDLTQKIIADLKNAQNDPLNYKIIAEPGRFFSSPSFYLLVRIIGRKQQNNRTYYYLNQSIYQSLREAENQGGLGLQNSTYQFYSRFSLTGVQSQSFETKPATLYGMTCSRNDIITHNINVPNDLQIGDWLCIGGVGAYSSCFASNYNGMKDSHKIISLE